MDFNPTKIPDVVLIKPKVVEDRRGFFLESYRASVFSSMGISTNFVQDNHSGSSQGTLRGLHYQVKQTQGKLVRTIIGEIYDVVVDLRRSSPTFGRWVGILLSAKNKCQLWVPKGCAHGFLVTSEWAEVLYKVTDYYAPAHERTLIWNDPNVKVEWPLDRIPMEPVLSEKDSQGALWADVEFFD